MEIDIQEIKQKLDKKLEKGIVSGRMLLDRMRVINEFSRHTSAYADPRYVPFYFYLGGMIQPKSLLEVGFNLGLLSGCFLKNCKSVENFLAFQPQRNEYYSPRLGKANVRDGFRGNVEVYIGGLFDDAFQQKISPISWDVIILNDETDEDTHSAYLDFVWPHLSDGGIIVMDYIASHRGAKDSFHSFCDSKNLEPVTFATRYGTGVIQK